MEVRGVMQGSTLAWTAIPRTPLTPLQLHEAATALGPRLQDWLKPAARARAGLPPAHAIALTPGEFAVLLSLDLGPDFHSGAVLPCRWRVATDERGAEPGECDTVPARLQEHARSLRDAAVVQRLLPGLRSPELQRLRTLTLSLGSGCGDLRSLPLDPDSASAALAATLAMVAREETPAHTVCASACFGVDAGLHSVAHLEEKLQAAGRAGLHTVLVSPDQRAPTISAHHAETPALSVAPSGGAAAQLAWLMQRFDAMPDGNDVAEASAWYDRSCKWVDTESRRRSAEYYATHVAPALAGRLKSVGGGRRDTKTLIASATGRSEVLFTVIGALQPRHVALVWEDSHSKALLQGFLELVERVGPAVWARLGAHPTVESVGLTTLLTTTAASDPLPDLDGLQRCTVDLTGGTTRAKLALSDWAVAHGVQRTIVVRENEATLATSMAMLPAGLAEGARRSAGH